MSGGISNVEIEKLIESLLKEVLLVILDLMTSTAL